MQKNLLRFTFLVPGIFVVPGALFLAALLWFSVPSAQALPTTSAPSFSAPQKITTATPANTMLMGDFDGDGIPDVAVVASSGKVEVHYGDGAGGFRSTNGSFTVTNTISSVGGVAAADLDSDGTSELIFAVGSSVIIYDQQSDGSFAQTRLNGQPWTPIDLTATGINATKVAVGNLTSAGSQDIVVSDDYGSVGVVWIPNDGTGNFGTPTAYAASGCGYYSKLLLADVNGDGLADVILNGGTDYQVRVLLNKGDGTLGAATAYGNSSLTNFRAQAATVADINGDGHPDIIQTGYVHDINTFDDTYSLSVNTNNGDGTFADGQTFSFPVNGGSRIGANVIDSGAFTGSSNNGVITTYDNPTNGSKGFIISQWNSDTNLTLARQDSFAGDFQSYSSIALGYTATNGVFVTFNNDPLPDVLLGVTSTIYGSNNTTHNEFVLFQNQAPAAPPTGRDVSFQKASYTVNEGEGVDVTVTRGTDSTGQVLEYFSVGGSAVQSGYGVKNPDYTIANIVGGQQAVTFATNEFSKTIHIDTASIKGKQPDKTILLSLLEPVGDSELGTITNATVTIKSSNPSTLGKAGLLTVKPTNLFTPTPKGFGVKLQAAGRTGSDWIFAVSQPLPASASNATVTVQASPYSTNQWTNYLTLTQGKGTAWSGTNQNPPLSTEGYFRTVVSAPGFPDLIGPPTKPFAIFPGPNLTLNLTVQSDSDTYGATTHEGETNDYHFTLSNVSPDTDGTNVVLSFPIPVHTTFSGASGPGTLTLNRDKKGGHVTSVTCTFGSIQANTVSTTEDIKVTVDGASAFSSTDPNKGFGYMVTASGYNLSALGQGVKSAVSYVPQWNTAILGPIKLKVYADHGRVDPGGLITYTLDCENDSATPITNAIVTDEIPAGTELASVYTFDQSGSATTTPLPNPGVFSTPTVIYAKTDTLAKIDFSHPPVSLSELLKLGNFVKASPGDELDLSNLEQGTIDVLVNDGFIAPSKIKWVIPLIPGIGGGQSNLRSVALTVRVPYDASSTDNGAQAYIVNGHYNKKSSPATYLGDHSSYDFILPGSKVSALYGNQPLPINVAINFVPPTPNQPHLFLEKCAKGDQNLNNPNFHGSGYSTLPFLGDLVTVAANHGVDYQLIYRNDLDINGNGADAHGVVLHDVIPEGMQLCGFFTQNVNGGGSGQMYASQFTFYDKNGLIIPGVDPDSNSNNMALVRSMDIRLGSVAAITSVPKNSHGYVEYTCQPTITPQTVLTFPGWDFAITGGMVHAFGGFQPGQGLSGKYQGFYISTSDQLNPVQGCPDDCVVHIVADVSWNSTATVSVNDSQPFDIVPLDITYTQNGDVSAPNSTITFGVPQGVTFLNNASVIPPTNAVVTIDSTNHEIADGRTAFDSRPYFVDSNTLVGVSQIGTNVTLSLGTVNGHTTRTVRAFFQVNGPALDASLKSAGGFTVHPHISGTYVSAPTPKSLIRSLGITAQSASSKPQVAEADANSTMQKVHDLNPPLLGISRNQPFSVKRGSSFTFTIHVSNHGDTAASNVTVGMQIPWRTAFVPGGTDNGELDLMTNGAIAPSANPTAYTIDKTRDASQSNGTGGGPDIISWHFASLPPQSSLKINLTVKCGSQFGDEAIQDHSAYVKADNVGGTLHIAADPLTVWIFDNDLNESKIQAAQIFMQNAGVTVTPALDAAVALIAKSLTTTSQVQAIAGLDSLQLPSAGVKIIPIGKGQVLLIAQDGSGIVAAGGGNVISNDGGSFVAQGDASKISVNTGINGFGTKTAEYLLNNIPAIVAAGGGNIVAAGGGNLIGEDGASLLSNEPGGGILGPISSVANGIVAAGGGNIVAAGGGNIVAAGGGNIINQDGNGLIPQDGAGLINQDGNGLMVTGTGIISHDSGGLIPQEGR